MGTGSAGAGTGANLSRVEVRVSAISVWNEWSIYDDEVWRGCDLNLILIARTLEGRGSTKRAWFAIMSVGFQSFLQFSTRKWPRRSKDNLFFLRIFQERHSVFFGLETPKMYEFWLKPTFVQHTGTFFSQHPFFQIPVHFAWTGSWHLQKFWYENKNLGLNLALWMVGQELLKETNKCRQTEIKHSEPWFLFFLSNTQSEPPDCQTGHLSVLMLMSASPRWPSEMTTCQHSAECLLLRNEGTNLTTRHGSRILVRGPSRVLTKGGGALSPNIAQNRGFPLKFPENCMILKKSWGQGGLGPSGSASDYSVWWGSDVRSLRT